VEPVRVLIAAGDRLARAGLASLIEGHDLIVAGRLALDEADEDAWEAAVTAFQPDVVVLDLGGPAAAALDAVTAAAHALGAPVQGEEHEWSGAPILALVEDAVGAAAARARGALGVVLRTADAAQLAGAARAVAAGLAVATPDLVAVAGVVPDVVTSLTPREVEVLALFAEGLSNRQIAAALGISVHTAKDHVDHVMAKLGASSRTGAAIRAARLGWLRL